MRINFKKRVNTIIIISFRGRDHYIKEQSSKPTNKARAEISFLISQVDRQVLILCHARRRKTVS